MNIVSSQLKDIRLSKKLTQKQLSLLTGFSQNTISNHENGNRSLSENDIQKYMKALDISLEYLFDSILESSGEISSEDLNMKREIRSLNEKDKKKVLELIKRLNTK